MTHKYWPASGARSHSTYYIRPSPPTCSPAAHLPGSRASRTASHQTQSGACAGPPPRALQKHNTSRSCLVRWSWQAHGPARQEQMPHGSQPDWHFLVTIPAKGAHQCPGSWARGWWRSCAGRLQERRRTREGGMLPEPPFHCFPSPGTRVAHTATSSSVPQPAPAHNRAVPRRGWA